MSDTPNIQRLVDFVRVKVPAVTEEQIFCYFLWGEAESIRDFTLDEMARALRDGTLSYTRKDLEEWLRDLGDSFEEIALTCRQTFVDTPDLYL